MGLFSSKSKENEPKAKSTETRAKRLKAATETSSRAANVAKENALASANANTNDGGRSTQVRAGTLLISSGSSAFQDNRTLWSDEELLSQLRHIDRPTSANIVKLFDEGNTIPFICRYRREMINHMDADE